MKRYKIIRYEDLVENSQEVLLSILEFCELDKANLAVPPLDSTLNQKQISKLSDYDIETITRIAQPMLIHFGYDILNRDLKW